MQFAPTHLSMGQAPLLPVLFLNNYFEQPQDLRQLQPNSMLIVAHDYSEAGMVVSYGWQAPLGIFQKEMHLLSYPYYY